MQINTSKVVMSDCLEGNTYQDAFPGTTECTYCKAETHPIMVIDDDEGLVADNSPIRVAGKPIHPHDSAVFVLYMCNECGEVTVRWNQA